MLIADKVLSVSWLTFLIYDRSKFVPCDDCGATGMFTLTTRKMGVIKVLCRYCKGTGWHTYEVKQKPIVDKKHIAHRCKNCQGLGKVRKYSDDVECSWCHGTGFLIYKKPQRKKKRLQYPVYDETQPYEWFRSKLRDYLLSKRGTKCEKCGMEYRTKKVAKENIFVHHIKLTKDGGTDEEDNLILVCYDCHQKEHDFDISYGLR